MFIKSNNYSREALLKRNNFNIIRLFAAVQVFFTHAIDHLEIKNEYINYIYYNFIYYFPGVPIFFTISGFLIYASFDRNSSNLKKYFKNRILRIYPALYLCLGLTIVLLYNADIKFLFYSLEFYKWLIAQLTFAQFYTPDILRTWGVGTPNGSLWTIFVEIQFYLIVPIIFLLTKKQNKLYWLLLMFSFSLLINLILNQNNTVFLKLFHLFVFKYLYYFLFGVISYVYWNNLYNIFLNKFLLITTIYILYFLIVGIYLNHPDIVSYILVSPFGFIGNLLLAIWTLSAAFSYNKMSIKIPFDIDISYGIYIYHMPIINFYIFCGLKSYTRYLFEVLIIVLIIALFSWLFVEKPLLKIKK